MNCPDSSIIFDELHGEFVCVETGEVIEERLIDQGPEWRAYTHEEFLDRARAGSRLTNKVHDLGISTAIDTWSPEGRRLQSIHRKLRISNNKQRKLVKALSLMNDVIGRLGLPNNVNEFSGSIIRKLSNKGLIKDRNVNAFIAASIILSCNYLKTPINRDEVLKICEVTRHDLWKAMLKITRDSGEYITVKVPEPQIYLDKLRSELGLRAEVSALANRILSVARNSGLTSGKGPIGLAAAALYIASVLLDDKRTQKEIAEKCNITEVTVRNRYRDLVDNITIVIEV
ncbi:MAG: TFIIB-type zinc ribbon-containing protein [Sulfolobales archaeon]